MEYTTAELELRDSQAFRSWGDKKLLESLSRLNKSATDERHYTVAELAKMWSVSEQTVREIFRNEEGVLKIGSNGNRNRRGYITLRIPESVVERVHARLSA